MTAETIMQKNCLFFDDDDDSQNNSIDNINNLEDKKNIENKKNNFRMSAGDFVEIYKNFENFEKYDVVVTCFFIDTAPVVFEFFIMIIFIYLFIVILKHSVYKNKNILKNLFLRFC
jgi:hypothetical protein